jgi:hypothetical protein
MKKSLFTACFAALIMFGGCATNFQNWNAWETDKQGEKFAAEVLTSEAKDGIIHGTAKIYKTSEVVKYVQKPFLFTEQPFAKGATIFVNIDKK